MNLARKPAVALLVAILMVVALSASFQLPECVSVADAAITITYWGVLLAIIAAGSVVAAIIVAVWPTDRQEIQVVGALSAEQSDGLSEFAREINRHVAAKHEAQIAALEQIRQQDRVTTVEHLAAGIAHDLGTPLSVTSARAELIATTDLPRDEVVHSAKVIVEQADRMTAIIRQLLDFSRRGVGRRVEVDLRQVVTTTIDLISGIAHKAKVEIICDTGDVPVPVHVDKNTMQQALTNIALNGIQAMPHGGRLRVHIETRQLLPPADVSDMPGLYQCVILEDDGVGIPTANLHQLFEPFFTTKRAGEGTGLGLPVAHGIVAENGGWIAVESVEGRGSKFSVMLPRPSAVNGRREVAA